MKVVSIYEAFMGEQSHVGIGKPVLVLRLGGCNVRCYKETLGLLCDTPEALEASSGEDRTPISIIKELRHYKKTTGIKTIMLTGGEPLFRSVEAMNELFLGLHEFKVLVETNGTINFSQYLHHKHVSFIVDIKSPSTGIKSDYVVRHFMYLRKTDTIKYVIKDAKDFEFFVETIEYLKKAKCQIAVGTFWGGEYDQFRLIKELCFLGLAGRVDINIQAHKLILSADYTQLGFPRNI